ncbi:OmpA family protein [Flammeovirga sp. MY04]|uniref:OmpA family protein n=1 Tax=Flammeovirga sp. MY04 TaxID=1191459 RepID=UPI0008265224|nr:OmpA family protein [Flammeovirga sp. MY04]ANQ50434.2 OmpA family protein [Flammeovirga sp. MY04]
MIIKNLIKAIFLFLISSVTLFGQTPLEQKGIAEIFAGDIDASIITFRKSLIENPNSCLSQFALANQLFEKVSDQKLKEMHIIRFKNMDGYFSDLREAYKWSLLAAESYQKLSEQDKLIIRQSLSVAGDEVNGFLSSRIQQTAYTYLQQAPYRRPTNQLYRTEVYNRIMEGDTLIALREILIRQCGEYLDDYPNSKYLSKVRDIRKGVLKEYLSNVSLRQYGNRSGAMYEHYCKEIISLYTSEELKFVVPTYYGKEYGFNKSSMYKSDNYKKLKKFAESEGVSIIEVLCYLNIHDKGCTPESEELYDRFIQSMAPMDIALIAVKKMTERPFKAHDFEAVRSIYKKYQPFFPDNQHFFTQILKSLEDTSNPRILKNLGNHINTVVREYQPVITLDEEYLFFARKTAKSGEDVYMSKKDFYGNWTQAQEIAEVNTESHEVPMGISGDGQTLLLYGNYSKLRKYSYVRGTESRLGKGDFYYSKKLKDGTWGAVQVFEYPINTPYYESGLSLSLDGDVAFFASDRPGAVGGYNPNYPEEGLYYHGAGEFNTDLYVSVKKEDGSWDEPINLGEVINTPFAEKNPYLHPDKETLYFCSDGHPGYGGYDIFMSKRLNPDSWTEWSEPVNLGISINGVDDDAFYLTSVGDKALVVSRKGDVNYGRDDIYELELPKNMRPKPLLFAHGKVVDNNGEGLDRVTIKIKDDDGDIVVTKKTGDNGEFQLALPPDANYSVFVDDENMIGSSIEIDVRKDPDLNLKLQEMKTVNLNDKSTDASFVMTTLNFDTNSYKIRKESFFDLDRLAALMLRNELWLLVIEGHTDNVDTKEHNIELSKNRANAVKTYLIEKGVHESRLDAYGFGEERPVMSNRTNAGRQENRRVVFSILR